MIKYSSWIIKIFFLSTLIFFLSLLIVLTIIFLIALVFFLQAATLEEDQDVIEFNIFKFVEKTNEKMIAKYKKLKKKIKKEYRKVIKKKKRYY